MHLDDDQANAGRRGEDGLDVGDLQLAGGLGRGRSRRLLPGGSLREERQTRQTSGARFQPIAALHDDLLS